MWKQIWVALLLLVSAQCLAANEYRTQLSSTEREANSALLSQGLAQVLVQLTGDRAIVEQPLVKKALATPENYLASSSSDQREAQVIWQFGYSASQLDTLLKETKQGYWGGVRAPVLVWLVVDNGSERRIIWDQDSSDYDQLLRQAAQHLAVPVQMPIGDLDDAMAISVPDIWGGFSQPIATASERYQAKSVLVIKARQAGHQPLQAQWQLWNMPASRMGGQSASISGQGMVGADGALADVFTQVVQYHAKLNAPKEIDPQATQSTGLALRVYQIHNSKDYFELERMLKSLTSVAQVKLRNITGDYADVELKLLSGEDQFYQDLLNDGRVQKKALPKAPAVVVTTPKKDPEQALTTVDKMQYKADSATETPVQAVQKPEVVTPTMGYFWQPNQDS
nr:DUF2066 domain-containing protein [Vibrio stylophorae]